MKNIVLTASILLISSCASAKLWYKDSWAKGRDCSIVCDYEMNSLTTSYTVSPTECNCYSPDAAYFNDRHLIPLDKASETLTCKPDCKSIADDIVRRYPWREIKY